MNNTNMGRQRLTLKPRVPIWLSIILLGLPLTHAFTIDFPFRWRLSEVIAWLLAPAIIVRPWGIRSLRGKAFIYGFTAYILYTGGIGLVMSQFVPIEIPAALEGTIAPIYRTLLESARLIAALAVVIAIYAYVRANGRLEAILMRIIAGGIFLSLYTVYEIAVLYLGFPLPLAPGSRSIPGFPVAATMYEPSSAGSYGAMVALLSFGLLTEGVGRIFPLVGVIAGIATVILTTSRTGVVSLTIGFAVLLLTYLVKHREGLIGMVLGLAIGMFGVWVAVVLAEKWLGALFYNRFNVYSVQYYLAVRQDEIYANVLPHVSKWPFGLGQGLWLYLVGGGATAARLVVEGGVIGMVLLGMMALGLLNAVLRIILEERVGPLKVSTVAAATATLVGLYNYVNLSDTWIWVVLALPIVASEVKPGRQLKTPVRKMVSQKA